MVCAAQVDRVFVPRGWWEGKVGHPGTDWSRIRSDQGR